MEERRKRNGGKGEGGGRRRSSLVTLVGSVVVVLLLFFCSFTEASEEEVLEVFEMANTGKGNIECLMEQNRNLTRHNSTSSSSSSSSSSFSFSGEEEEEKEREEERKPILPEVVGWLVVIGFGAFFSIFTTWLVKAEEKYLSTEKSSEWFNTAGRNIGTGLTSAVIVSQWTWAATLLQSSTVALKYGISGPFWYAAGASVQVLLFAMVAIEIKRKAPNCHTFLEIINCRWGPTAHKIFMVWGFCANMIVTAMLLLGGGAVVADLTGMPVSAAIFLIPIGTLLYVLEGGLKATFLACYVHTAIIYICLLIFIFTVYVSSPLLGSPKAVYDRLVHASEICPIDGNEEGSYLTMSSFNGLAFGVINVVGNFGTVFVDQAYWQAAIAARPSSTVKGFFLGALCWFAIPFTLATTLGLAAVALRVVITEEQIDAGLVPAVSAVHLLGRGGAVMLLLMLFMAVTSAGSAELIAVSSLITYDVYRTYINPEATGHQLLKCSRISVVSFGLFMGGLGVVLHLTGLNLNYVYLAMGAIIGAAVVPIAMVLMWKDCQMKAACAGVLIGFVLSITSWLVTAKAIYGEVTYESTGQNTPLLVANLVAISSGGAIAFIGTMIIGKANFDWNITRTGIKLVDGSGPAFDDASETDEEMLTKVKKLAVTAGLGMALFFVVLWPLPMYISKYIFSEEFFGGWIVLGFIWAIIASLIIIITPLWESRSSLWIVILGLATTLKLRKHHSLDETTVARSTTTEEEKRNRLFDEPEGGAGYGTSA